MNMNMNICSSAWLKDKEGNELGRISSEYESITENEWFSFTSKMWKNVVENQVEIQFANSGNKESVLVEGKT